MNKDILKNICGCVEGANCWHPLAKWLVLALTERSFPAHLHSSLLVEEAGQGICNKENTVRLYFRKRSARTRISFTEWIHTGAACVHACLYMRVEEVTMRFVIHFVSVYSIIHPGVQRASNMPGTACDRVQQPCSEIFMRHFCVETEQKVPRYLSSWLALWMEMHTYVGQKGKQAYGQGKNGRMDKNHQTDGQRKKNKHQFYLCVVFADVEEVKREDVVLGSHQESPSLLVQQEGVVSRAVGHAFERHKVVRLQHVCGKKTARKWSISIIR